MRYVLYREIVKETAENLMKAHGKTTTLEVKLALRAAHFIAFQSEVSAHMDALAAENGWSFHFNGIFRTYYLPQEAEQQQANNIESGDFYFLLN
ncbi:hypothetical protein [Hugenholtzia roseola]|uniref:hypothetical protein n=1 Tax=Hugenholtzia roseola TaxID=1002 RepID=UPI0004062766|nr:hypothetical protein [Hugenholtzia roseola]